MRPEDVEVVIGDDPAVLEQEQAADPHDPSGFERYGYTQQNLAALCAFVRDTAIAIRRHVPADLLGHMPQRIPLYANRSNPGVAASLLYEESAQSPRNLQPLMGMIIGTPPGLAEQRSMEFELVIGHEHLHTAYYGAAESNSVNEAIVGRLETEYLPSVGYRRDRRWRPDAFTGTTGFRVDDGAAKLHTNESKSAEYMWTAHAMRFLTADQVWRICTGLVTSARAQGEFPSFDQVADAITGEDPVNGKKVLNTPPFQPMTRGYQQYVFPRGNDHLDVYTFSAVQNSEYDPNSPDLMKRIQFSARQDPAQKQLVFRLHNGRQVSTNPDALPGSQAIDFHDLTLSLEQLARIPASSVASIECKIRSGTFTIRR